MLLLVLYLCIMTDLDCYIFEDHTIPLETRTMSFVCRECKMEHYTDAEMQKGTWRYRVETNKVIVVIAFRASNYIRIVTAWRK